MTRNSETIVDENDIEILVGYRYDQSESQIEEQGYEAGLLVYTELTSVEVVIAGSKNKINILPNLTEKQKDFIISKLSYE